MSLIANYFAFWVYTFIFIFIITLASLAPKIIAPKKPSKEKNASFECGQIPDRGGLDYVIEGARHYIYYAIIFLVSDVAAWISFTYVESPRGSSASLIFILYLSVVLLSVTYFLKFIDLLK